MTDLRLERHLLFLNNSLEVPGFEAGRSKTFGSPYSSASGRESKSIGYPATICVFKFPKFF